MQIDQVDPEIQAVWRRPLFTRRLTGTIGDILFDFKWKALFGHNQPKFPGCADLTKAIAEYARQHAKLPAIILSDKIDYSFDIITTDHRYIAVVNIKEYRKCIAGHDRSALFFLAVLNKVRLFHGGGGAEVTPKVAQLLTTMEIELSNDPDLLVDALDTAGSQLTVKLLNAAVKALKRSATQEDITELIDLFDSDSVNLIEDVATLVRRERATREYDQHLRDRDWDEKAWQGFFEREQWIFGHGLLYQFLHLKQREMFVGGKDMANKGGQVTDFGMLTQGFGARFIALVDIKTPQKQLVKNAEIRNGAHAIHGDLAEAIAQIQSNCDRWSCEGRVQTANVEAAQSGGWQTAHPRGIVVIGNTSSLDTKNKRQSFELFRRHLHAIEVLTFDELLIKAKALASNNPVGRNGVE